MAIISTGSHPKALWPGVKKWWGVEYAKYPAIWSQIFDMATSDQNYEEDVEDVGFGLMQTKTQGAGISYDTAQQGTVTRYTHITYGLGFIVTMEEIMDNLYEKISFKRAARLAQSVAETEEVIHANVLNRAFDTNYTFGDGKAMIVSDHPTANGTQSNVLTTAADLSEASLEDMVNQMKQATNSRGLKIMNKPKRLIIPAELGFEAVRILKSVQQNDTANNAVNALKTMGTIPEIIENPWLTDADAWFIQATCPDGLTHYTRMPADYKIDSDFDSSNAKSKVVMRWSQGISNFRSMWGSAGA